MVSLIENNDVANKYISDIEVNKIIQQKFVRIITSCGEGSGCIIDDEKGIILSSFHLVGHTKCLNIFDFEKFRDIKMLSVLIELQYINDNFEFTKRFYEIESINEIIDDIRAIVTSLIKNNTSKISHKNIKKIVDQQRDKIISAVTELNTIGDINIFHKIFPHDADYIVHLLKSTNYLNANETINTEKIPSDINNIINTIHKKYENTDISFSHNISDEYVKILIENTNNIIKDLLSLQNKENKETILVTEYVEIDCDGEILKGSVYIPSNDPIDRQKILNNYSYFDTVPIMIDSFSDGCQYSPLYRFIKTGHKINCIPNYENIMIGEKVYFGGYPLTQDSYNFATGNISSITYSEARITYIIDAPIMAGNSGSNVFVQNNGKIYSIGVINSCIANVSEKILENKKTLEVMGTGAIQIRSKLDGSNIDVIEMLKELTTTLLENLSTGKGKAFNIPEISDLWNPTFIDHTNMLFDYSLDFLVPKSKNAKKKKCEIQSNITPRIHVPYVYDGEIYYLISHTHNNKHFEFSDKMTQTKLDNWHNIRMPATFYPEIKKNNKNILETLIKTVVKNKNTVNNKNISFFVNFKYPIGWDEGVNKKVEKTSIIELYYDETGSHMRPKAESQLIDKHIIDIEDEDEDEENNIKNIMDETKN